MEPTRFRRSVSSCPSSGGDYDERVLWKPRHLVTRRTAQITRELQCAWNARLGAGTTVVPAEKVLALFNDLHIYPTNVQVQDMLQCAQKCASRNSANYLTFAEFCIFATELKRTIHTRLYRRNSFLRLLQKDGPTNKNKKFRRKMSESRCCYEVFLGGSCNPTTWRKDEAIPLLEKLGITYYNPQVSHWSPELIELEHQAKQNAAVLLFVLDNKTRNVVSFIETSNFIGNRRRVGLVIHPYKKNQPVSGESVSSEEFVDLNSSVSLLIQLVERRKLPIFEGVCDAVHYVSQVIKETEDFRKGHRLVKMKEAFEALDSEKCGLISTKDICKAFRLLSQKRSQSAELKRNIFHKIDGSKKSKDIKINFEQFCKIVSELNLNSEKIYSNGIINKKPNCSIFFRSLSSPDDTVSFDSNELLTDIYLGGDCYSYITWRQDIAIPMIRKSCLTFYNPENERRYNQALSSNEFNVLNNANVLLFVITNSSRSLFTMILASYYLGVGAEMVLCIQQIPDNQYIGSERLSEQALKDYNRGRLYLTDMARRQNVPIFDTIPEAVEAAINKCIR